MRTISPKWILVWLVPALGACSGTDGNSDRSTMESLLAPAPVMVSPTDAALVSGTITVAASLKRPTSAAITFFQDNWSTVVNSSPLTSAPYAVSIDTTTLANGRHSFWARAVNAAGTGASDVVTIDVENDAVPPTPMPSCTPIAPIALGGFDPLPAVESARITSGSFAGGYAVAQGDGRLNWYFSNIGLLGFVDRIPSEVKTYLDLYLANVAADYSIPDIYFTCGTWECPTTQAKTWPNGYTTYSDSHDSYAATFLSLAARYYATTCDAAWLKSPVPGRGVTVLQALKKIADNNIVNSQWPNGLVHVFQDADAYYVAYTEDNAEAYRGLADFAAMLTSLGDGSASGYAASAQTIAAAVASKMYSDTLTSGTTSLGVPGFFFSWGDAASFAAPAEPLNDPLAFYPDGASQIFAQTYRLGMASSVYDAAWSFLNANFSYTAVNANGQGDPWTIIGYAAALHNDVALAQQMQKKTVDTYNGNIAVPLNAWSFYRRISIFLEHGTVF